MNKNRIFHLIAVLGLAVCAAGPAAAAKILHDSFKEHELPRMKAFWLDDIVHDAGDIKKLADLPSKDQLYSMVAAAVEAPIAELVRSLDAVHWELIGCIDALAEKKKGEE